MNAQDKNYVQFSKRIAILIAFFWCAYRMLLVVLTWMRPEIGTSMERMLTGVDDVMMVSIGFYTGNSVIEKGITGYFGAKNFTANKMASSDKGEG